MIVAVRDFIVQLTNSIITVLRIVLLSNFFTKKISRNTQNKEAVILGNGPSLNAFLENDLRLLQGRAVFAVNYFARTEEYATIKPTYYVICSPEYFLAERKEEFAQDRKETFKAIAQRTSWNMQLIVPALAKKNSIWKSEIEKNSNISIRYINTTPIEGFKSIVHFFFSRNLGMPRPHNVLIPSIFIAINLAYQKVYLTGTDHSWLKEIVVDEDNEVLLSQKHFYDKQTLTEKIEKNKPTAKPMFKGISTEKRKLHEVLEKFYISFRSYWTLKNYADSRKVTVLNLTKESYIDAFEKPGKE